MLALRSATTTMTSRLIGSGRGGVTDNCSSLVSRLSRPSVKCPLGAVRGSACLLVGRQQNAGSLWANHLRVDHFTCELFVRLIGGAAAGQKFGGRAAAVSSSDTGKQSSSMSELWAGRRWSLAALDCESSTSKTATGPLAQQQIFYGEE